MDDSRFDRLARRLGNVLPLQVVRRGALGLALAGFLPSLAVARRRRKRKRKPLLLNEFGCVPVGQPCKGNGENCCSGICEGSPPRKGNPDRSRCAGHHAGNCQPGSPLGTKCTTHAGESGVCTTTTGAAGYCARIGGCSDEPCRKDADCGSGLPYGSRACVRDPSCPGGTSCAVA
jgi:hypothetical protein